MLPARRQEKKVECVVNKGYVYSDGVGNNFREGDRVEVTEKQLDLAKHRLRIVKDATKQEVMQELPKITLEKEIKPSTNPFEYEIK